MTKVQYKVTNVTKWAGVKKGKHKNGFIIAINRRNIHVNRHMVVDEISEAIESFHRKKWVKIEPIENRHVTIKEATEKTEAENEKSRKAQEAKLKQDEKDAHAKAKQQKEKELAELEAAQKESESASSVDKDELKKQLRGSNTAQVVGQGNEDVSTDPTADLEMAEYVDGEEPNFVVNASKSKGKRGKRKSKQM